MYLVFDIGGTKTRLARSDDGKKISELITFSTGKNFKSGIAFFLQKTNNITGGAKLIIIAGGIAGALSPEKDKICFSPNLPGWVGKPIKATIEHALKAPTILENDAALAALGEAVSGAGRGFSIVAYITVSTGVGGARVVDGKIDRNSFGFEPGEQLIAENYNLESSVSGAAFRQKYGKDPQKIRSPRVWHKAALDLSRGLHNILVLWSPEALILGGPMILGRPQIPFLEIKRMLKKTISPPFRLQLKKAELGDLSGLHGALALARLRGTVK